MKKQWKKAAAMLLSVLFICASAGCAQEPVQMSAAPEVVVSAVPETPVQAETTPVPVETSAPVSEESAGLTPETFFKEHGALRSTTEEAVTAEQLSAICSAAGKVTFGDEKTWHLTVIPTLDLLQELLPTYAEDGLIKEGNAAIIVSCSSARGEAEQFAVPDQSTLIAAGMITQQICVAAQMQGLGFKVITDSIHQSSYTLYKDNVADEEHLLKESMEWEEWVRMFAIPEENYYVSGESGEIIKTLSGEPIALKGSGYTYYEADGVTPAPKKKMEYVEGYMTPCAIVLLGNTEEELKKQTLLIEDFVTVWDGSYDPYPENYGGSGPKPSDTASLTVTEAPQG